MKKTLLYLICFVFILSLVGCGKITSSNSGKSDIGDFENQKAEGKGDVLSHLTVLQQSDKTFSYTVTDYNGTVLDKADGLTREPKGAAVNTAVVGVSVQAGTGLSTNYAKYYDIKNGRISETFNYVLAAQGDYVVCADYKNGEHIITVYDIFDRSKYRKDYKLENVSPVAADFAVSGRFNSNNSITVTYLSGDDYNETDSVIII